MGMTQSYTVADQNANVSQTVAVSVGGAGNDQFTFGAGVGADTMLNFSTITNAQGHYAGDTVELNNFTAITSVSDVLAHLSADSHGNAMVDLGNHDSITFQGVSVAVIQANASHIFQV
jgi:Ca2+-binding RTX toxin-like protein